MRFGFYLFHRGGSAVRLYHPADMHWFAVIRTSPILDSDIVLIQSSGDLVVWLGKGRARFDPVLNCGFDANLSVLDADLAPVERHPDAAFFDIISVVVIGVSTALYGKAEIGDLEIQIAAASG